MTARRTTLRAASGALILGALASGCAGSFGSRPADPDRPRQDRLERRVEQVGEALATDDPALLEPWSRAQKAVEAAEGAPTRREQTRLLNEADRALGTARERADDVQ